MILAAFLIIFFIWLYPQRALKVRTYELLPKKGEKFLVFSDLHNNGLLPFSRLERIVKRESPSGIFLLGDLIDRGGGYKNTRRFLDILEASGVSLFYVHGNHERDAPDFWQLREQFDRIGAINLEGESMDFRGLRIHGIAYRSGASYLADIYLCHNPVDALKGDFPGLYLSGHTHGGMVRFPLIKTFYVPDQKFMPDYHKGLYELKDKKLLITSGIGNTFLPLRFLNPIELIIIK